jgi:hypothetical protein
MAQGKRKIEESKKRAHKDKATMRTLKEAVVRYQGKGGAAGGNGQQTPKKT